MKYLTSLLLLLSLSGCYAIYKTPVEQGNLVTISDLSALRIDMSKDEIRSILGSPALSDAFNPNIWDYSYYKLKRGKLHLSHKLLLYFNDGKLTKIQTTLKCSKILTPVSSNSQDLVIEEISIAE